MDELHNAWIHFDVWGSSSPPLVLSLVWATIIKIKKTERKKRSSPSGTFNTYQKKKRCGWLFRLLKRKKTTSCFSITDSLLERLNLRCSFAFNEVVAFCRCRMCYCIVHSSICFICHSKSPRWHIWHLRKESDMVIWRIFVHTHNLWRRDDDEFLFVVICSMEVMDVINVHRSYKWRCHINWILCFLSSNQSHICVNPWRSHFNRIECVHQL